MRFRQIAFYLVITLALSSLTEAQPSLVLKDGGIEFPDGSVQETSAVLPAGPPTAFVNVDCGAGDSIMEALQTPADELTIQISGICNEIVITSRPDVTFMGTDPMTDGIDATGAAPASLSNPLNLLGTHGVDVVNLKLTGGVGGIGIDYSFSIDVINCRLEGNTDTGAFVSVGSSLVRFTDTVVTLNSDRGLWVSNGSGFSCTRCTVDKNGTDGLGTGILCSEGSTVGLNDSVVEGEPAVETSGCRLLTKNGTLEAKADGDFGLAVRAKDHSSVFLSNTSVVGPIWALDGSSVVAFDATQTVATDVTTGNDWVLASSLLATGTTSLVGGLNITEFSSAVIGNDASVTGNLT